MAILKPSACSFSALRPSPSQLLNTLVCARTVLSFLSISKYNTTLAITMYITNYIKKLYTCMYVIRPRTRGRRRICRRAAAFYPRLLPTVILQSPLSWWFFLHPPPADLHPSIQVWQPRNLLHPSLWVGLSQRLLFKTSAELRRQAGIVILISDEADINWTNTHSLKLPIPPRKI